MGLFVGQVQNFQKDSCPESAFVYHLGLIILTGAVETVVF